jgi:hypothetical protein
MSVPTAVSGALARHSRPYCAAILPARTGRRAADVDGMSDPLDVVIVHI